MTQAKELRQFTREEVATALVIGMGWSSDLTKALPFLDSAPAGKFLVKPQRWCREDIIAWIGTDLNGDEKTRAVDYMMRMKTLSCPAIQHMAKSIPELCFIWRSSAFDPDPNSGIPARLAFLYLLARFALYFEPRRSLRQRLPQLGQLAFPPKLLRRFLPGFVVATARKLVTKLFGVYVDIGEQKEKRQKDWMHFMFARAMSGFVVQEKVLLQADAAARIVGKSGVIAAAESGDVADVLSYLIADANCVNERRDG